MNKKHTQKNFYLMITLIAALGFFLTVFLATHQTNVAPKAGFNYGSLSVKSADDLNKAVEALDQTNINSIDSYLNQNERDASGF